MKYFLYFLEIARAKNLSRAAERLYVSQSALSQFLAREEAELGVKLFLRRHNTLLLTPAVEAKMAKRARGILSREIKKGDGDAGRAVRRFLGAVTWKGALCNFETVEVLCRRIYELSDPYGLAHPMLSQLAAGALAAGHDAILCPSPLYPDRLEHPLPVSYTHLTLPTT